MRGRRFLTAQTVRPAYHVPPSSRRCTVVNVDDRLRCMSPEGHGWFHEFSSRVPQALCGTIMIASDTGRIRQCLLPERHEGGCIFLQITERRITIDDLWRL